MNAEIASLAADILRAVKATLDPAGVLNPGKLIPEPVTDQPSQDPECGSGYFSDHVGDE